MRSSRRRFLRTSIGGALGGGALLSASACAPALSLPASHGSTGFAVPVADGYDLATHVLSRLTFGIRPGDRDALLALARDPAIAVERFIEAQLDPSPIDDSACAHAIARFAGIAEPAAEAYEYKAAVLLRDMVSATALRAATTRRQLHEVMVHFFTDHLNIDASKGDCAWLKAADDRDVIRAHALGRFGDLVRASARSAAMLWYLDGRLNRRAAASERPNENYARELLELHTLGVHGGYTQGDVMEVARCLTGWTVRPRAGFGKGRVEFHPELHDDSGKTVLGTFIPPGLGEGDLDRVVEIATAHPSTARHIAFKLCRRFIADAPPEPAVAAVAAAFQRSQGDIRKTLRALFARPEFLAESPSFRSLRGGKVKRPFHYVVSCLRATDAKTDARPELCRYLAAMGQAPFQLPTPDGYPDVARAWEGTLLHRFRLVAELGQNRIPGTRIDAPTLRLRAGGSGALAAHCLGRRPTAREMASFEAAGSDEAALSLMLASPAFQRY